MSLFRLPSSFLLLFFFLDASQVMAKEAITAGEKLYIGAVSVCDLVKAKDLVAKGVDPTVTNGGATALHYAIYANCSAHQLVSELISFGVDPNKTDRNNIAPIHESIYRAANRGTRIVEALLSGGADPNLVGSNGQRVPIVDAAKFCVECVEPLLNAGADPELKNAKGERAVAILIEMYKWESAELLFKLGANPNELIHGDHPFCFALQRPAAPELIDLLVSYGADPKILDSLGENSVSCALRYILRNGGQGIYIL